MIDPFGPLDWAPFNCYYNATYFRNSSVEMYSSMKKRRGNLAGRIDVVITLPKWAPELLTDFANASAEWFNKQWHKKWQWRGFLPWTDESEEFSELQEVVRKVWRGKASGEYEVSRHLGLGKYGSEREFGGSPLYIDWKKGNLYLGASDLNEVLWFTLLHYSQHLGICANEKSDRNPDGTCVTPFFIKYRPQQQFCSEECALPAQRESKRRWWSEHREDWLKGRKHKANRKVDGEKNKRGSTGG